MSLLPPRASLLAAALLCTVALTPLAVRATPITGTFDITIYQGTGNGSISAPIEQANLANPLFNTAAVATVVYTGALDFNANANTLGAFFASGGGTYTGLGAAAGNLLSSGNFSWTSLFNITGVTAGPASGLITHDDGISLYQFGKTVASSASPTVAIPTSYSLAPGAFDLVYLEANDLPAVLNVDNTYAPPVPEPASILVLAIGLAGLYSLRRPRRA